MVTTFFAALGNQMVAGSVNNEDGKVVESIPVMTTYLNQSHHKRPRPLEQSIGRETVEHAKLLADCTDEELLKHFDSGQRDAFGVLVRRYERELYGYLCRYVGDSSLAEDVFQNTFLQLYTKISTYEHGRPVRPWLYTIATHQAIDAMRRVGRQSALSLDQHRDDGSGGEVQALIGLLESEWANPLEHVQAEERRQWVRDSVDRLPDFLKQVVVLAYYQGLKYREIADILEIPLGTVKSRLHSALIRLQEAWTTLAPVKE